MFFIIAGVLLAAPGVIHVGNRLLTEVLIPNKAKKLGQTPLPASFDLALMPTEIVELEEMGALEILGRGSSRHVDLVNTGEAKVRICQHCNRMH